MRLVYTAIKETILHRAVAGFLNVQYRRRWTEGMIRILRRKQGKVELRKLPLSLNVIMELANVGSLPLTPYPIRL
jgi:hypothetical protein